MEITKETELDYKIRMIRKNLKQEERIIALSPKFEKALRNSPFAFYGLLWQIRECQDENSPYSQFIKEFLQENGVYT